jgi:fructose-bisphosphate aldolase class II
MVTTGEIIKKAKDMKIAIPAFNVPYLPMVEPIIQAIVDEDSFSLIETARVEWMKMGAKGPREVYEEFIKWEKPDYVRLHLDHVPVIDEDNLKVDYLLIIKEALEMGYKSVMIDGSRLSFKDNIEVTKRVADLAHKKDAACEAELGAVMGHESGPIPPYEEIFASGKGFTDIKEAEIFVAQTNCDWLSVAIGNIHGAVSEALRNQKKPVARLNIKHLSSLSKVTGIPLVLHGGSGVAREYFLEAIKNGISKVNVGTELRQTYEQSLQDNNSTVKAQDAVYNHTRNLIRDYYNISGIQKKILS